MIIEFIPPHALNMGQNFEYISTFIKGRHKSIKNMRLLVRGVNDNKEYLIMLDPRPGFFGRKISYGVNITSIDPIQYITPTHIRAYGQTGQTNYSHYPGSHDYYFFDINANNVHDFFKTWKKGDPMVHIGNKTHQFISKMNNYKGSYRFDNQTY